MELYIKTVGDPNYDPNSIQMENEIEQVIAQIETILFTTKGEVLGQPEFGCNLEDLIYSLNYNAYQIESEINTQIARFCPLAAKYNVGVVADFKRGEVRDEVYIDITIDSKYYVQVYVG